MPGASGDQQLAETFAEISRALLAEPDVQRTLDKMCQLLVNIVEGCNHSVVTIVRDHHLESPAASDEVGPVVDAIQFELGEGPCVEAILQHHTTVTEDLIVEKRWPRFSRRVTAETGVRSMLAFRLFVAEETLGSLNLYSRQPRAFTQDSLAMGTIFAAHASVALRSAKTKEDLARLREMIETRELIGQAKGILMGRQGITSQAATDILYRGAERLRIELSEIARRIVSGEEGKSQT